MAYDLDKTWADFEREMQNHSRQTIEILYRGYEHYKDMVHYKAGRTNAEIATALGRTETDVDALETAVLALKALCDFADGAAVAQDDYADALRTFS